MNIQNTLDQIRSKIGCFIEKSSILNLLTVLCLIATTTTVFWFLSRSPKQVQAGWFNDHWMYRKSVAITNSGTDQTDFQVSFTMDTATLISDGKMDSSCNDIRITDINGQTLPHWVEESGDYACNDSDTEIWTKVPTIETSGATIYVYYGNPSTENSENGDDVFEFFDDFTGPDIDEAKWTQGTISSPSGTDFSQSSGKLSGGNNDRYIKSTTSFSGDYVATARVLTTTSPNNGYTTVGFWAATNNNFGILDNNNTSYYRDDNGWTNFSYNGEGQWNRDQVKVLGTEATYWRTGETSGSATASTTNSGLNSEYIRLGARYDNGPQDQNYDADWDWIFVRKTTSTEPSAGSPGTEEASPGPVYWKFDEGYGSTAYDSTQNSNDGSLGTGDSAPEWQSEDMCVSGKCLKFDGSDDYINQTNSFWHGKFTDSSDFTISGWVKLNAYPTEYTTIAGQRFGSSMVFGVTSSGELYLSMDDTRTSSPKSNNALETNKWYHVSVSFSGSDSSHTATYYINGSIAGSGTSYDGNGSASSNNTIGIAGFNLSTDPTDGQIDDVRIYNYALTDQQIKDLYNQGGAIRFSQ